MTDIDTTKARAVLDFVDANPGLPFSGFHHEVFYTQPNTLRVAPFSPLAEFVRCRDALRNPVTRLSDLSGGLHIITTGWLPAIDVGVIVSGRVDGVERELLLQAAGMRPGQQDQPVDGDVLAAVAAASQPTGEVAW